MTDVLDSARAEWLRVRKWPAVWIVLGGWLFLNILFSYVLPYLSYTSNSSNFTNDGIPRALLLGEVLPANVPASVVQGMPMFGGAIMFILGALVAGSGYAWGTWKTVFTQGPRRGAAIGGTLVTVLAVAVGVVLVTVVVDLALANAIAVREGRGLAAPPATDLLRSVGIGTAVFAMWASVGALVGTLTRSPALGVGLGLVWVLAVENLLRGVANLLEPLEAATRLMPGTGAGSLAGVLAASVGEAGGTPGVLDVLAATPAVSVMSAYLVISLLLTYAVVSRRDIA